MIPEIMKRYPQFVVWKLVQKPDKPKADKILFNPKTGQFGSASDPHTWVTYDAAVAAYNQGGYDGIGFVFTAADPFVFLDIDDCADSQVGGWKPHVTPIYQGLQGAAWETSQSGKGLHAIAYVQDKNVFHNCKNKFKDTKGNKFEFYTQGRFVAFGREGFNVPDIYPISSEFLRSFVPDRELSAAVPCDWEMLAPDEAEDAKLLDRMMRNDADNYTYYLLGGTAPDSIKPNFIDLWMGSPRVGLLYPDSKRAFDNSSAELALAGKLAYYTQNNPAWVERLMNKSPLCQREKWLKRQEYRKSTIQKVLKPLPVVEAVESYPEILDTSYKQKYFRDCYFVATESRIFTREAMFMNQTQFNGVYGGRNFCLDSNGGKVTDEPWKAALRSLDWTIPKVHHTRFLPDKPQGLIMKDELNRDGLNIFVKPVIQMRQGNIQPWFNFLHKILNTADDVRIFDEYLAHCIKYPGHKIPWAVLLQSAPGIGKQMILKIMKYCIGEMYTYEPKAEELISGGNRFNGWMREKLFIVVDEIRVGDRFDLLESLKKIITDARIAVEDKNVSQKMEDNVSNWLFFSNHKDAIPVSHNERRHCVFYSKLQSEKQVLEAFGNDGAEFNELYRWLEAGGYAAIAHYYHNHSVQRGSMAHRAPKTSSYDEVLRISRSPLEVIIDDKLASGERGFIGGYVSWPMLMKAIEASGRMRQRPADFVIEQMLENKGYTKLGYTHAPIGGEDMSRPSLIFGQAGLRVEGYR